MAKAIPHKRGAQPRATTEANAHANRETWLIKAVELLRPWFPPNRPLPPVRVSVGWPGRSNAKKNLGVCWDAAASKDKVPQIFISPTVDEANPALCVLLHQLTHAALGDYTAHNGEFAELARKFGFEAPLRDPLGAGSALMVRLNDEVGKALGPYPHARLNPEKSGIPKAGTRLIKCVCEKTGYTVRTTAKWLEEFGPPLSPATKKAMVVEPPPQEAA